jgi:regulator of RNase E activity RraA
MPVGCIAVVDAMGLNNVGIFGDILCARMKNRGVSALVTDGAVRDLVGVRKTGLPTWCNGTAAPPSVAGLTFVGWQQPIGCGGVAVFPGDIVVVDEDGAVVIPDSLLETVLKQAPEAEMMEAWVLLQVESGRQLTGLYPPNQEATEEYAAWLQVQKNATNS